MAAKPLGESKLVLLAIWRFDLGSKSNRYVRSLWIEGGFKSVFREAP